ncbi:MAG: thioredoxin family protein, partial [Allobaculum sp.]|nr:thioredoxin family protein [Allobaculum sp.]
LMPYLDALEKANPDVDFYKLDRDQLLDEAIAEEILGIPSLVVYEEGQEKGRFVSKLRKTPEEIQAFLDSLKK